MTVYTSLDVYPNIISLREDGKTYRAIANELGIPKSTCYDIIKRYERYDDEGYFPVPDYEKGRMYFIRI